MPAAPAAGGSPRRRLLEVVRAFGRARLQARDELESVLTRHLEHVCHLVATAATHLDDAEQLHAVAQLRELDADVDVALATAAERGCPCRFLAAPSPAAPAEAVPRHPRSRPAGPPS